MLARSCKLLPTSSTVTAVDTACLQISKHLDNCLQKHAIGTAKLRTSTVPELTHCTNTAEQKISSTWPQNIIGRTAQRSAGASNVTLATTLCALSPASFNEL